MGYTSSVAEGGEVGAGVEEERREEREERISRGLGRLARGEKWLNKE